jgi:hypothetical protein
MEVQSTGPRYNTTHFKRYIVPATVGTTVRYSSAHIDVTLDPCLRVLPHRLYFMDPSRLWKMVCKVKIGVSVWRHICTVPVSIILSSIKLCNQLHAPGALLPGKSFVALSIWCWVRWRDHLGAPKEVSSLRQLRVSSLAGRQSLYLLPRLILRRYIPI